MKTRMKPCFIITAFLALAASAAADTFIRTKHHTDAFEVMGTTVPASDKEVSSWIGTDKIRVDIGPDTTIIIDLATRAMQLVAHKTKTWQSLPMGDMKALMKQAMEESGMDEEDAENMGPMMEQMMQGMMSQFSATVTATGEKKIIGKWKCTKYVVKMTMPMGGSESEMWVTKDVQVDPSMVLRMRHAQLLSQLGFDSIMEDLKKNDGLPVQSVTRATVMSSTVVSTDTVTEVPNHVGSAHQVRLRSRPSKVSESTEDTIATARRAGIPYA